MSEARPIHWIAVDGYPDHEQMVELRDTLTDTDALQDMDIVLTTKDVEPMDAEERERVVAKLTQVFEDDE